MLPSEHRHSRASSATLTVASPMKLAFLARASITGSSRALTLEFSQIRLTRSMFV
jgi:hypothetical protein